MAAEDFSTLRYFEGASQEKSSITVPLFDGAFTADESVTLPVGVVSLAVLSQGSTAIEAEQAAGGVTYAITVHEEDQDVPAAALYGGLISTAQVVQTINLPVVARMAGGTRAFAIPPDLALDTINATFTLSATIGDAPQLAGTINSQFNLYADLTAPILPAVRTLGCGVYDVWLNHRGGTAIRKLIDVSDFTFNRVLNGVSEAQFTVGKGGGQSMSDECCAAISDINPWQHELAIYRGNDGASGTRSLVWVGPVRRIEIDPDQGQAFITAKDLFSWFDRRFWRGESSPNAGIIATGGDTNPDLDVDDTDLSYIWAQVVSDALLPDNPGILVENPNPTKTLAARFVARGQYRYAGDVLRELANSGIDYTMFNRTLRSGASEIQTPAIGLLIDEHFAKPPRLIIDGDGMATRWVVGGAGTGQDGPDEAGDTSLTLFVSATQQIAAINPIDPDFGLLEQYVFQPEIEDRPGTNDISTAGGSGRPSYTYFSGADNTDASYSIYQAARTRWELHHEPYTTIEGGELAPQAPFDFNTLVPGSVLKVALRSGCRGVQGYYRLHEVNVRVDDKRDQIDVRFENLGTSATVVPLLGPSPSDLPLANPPIYSSKPPYAYIWASWEPNYPAGSFDGFSGCRSPWEVTVSFVYPTTSGTPSKIVMPTQLSSTNPPSYDHTYSLSFEPLLTPSANATLLSSGTLDAFTSYQAWRFSGLQICVSGVSSRPYIGSMPYMIGDNTTNGGIDTLKQIFFGGSGLAGYLVGYDSNGVHAYHSLDYRFTS